MASQWRQSRCMRNAHLNAFIKGHNRRGHRIITASQHHTRISKGLAPRRGDRYNSHKPLSPPRRQATSSQQPLHGPGSPIFGQATPAVESSASFTRCAFPIPLLLPLPLQVCARRASRARAAQPPCHAAATTARRLPRRPHVCNTPHGTACSTFLDTARPTASHTRPPLRAGEPCRSPLARSMLRTT